MAEVKFEDYPKSIHIFYSKGIAALNRGNLDYAMDLFEAALHLEPHLLEIRKLLRVAAIRYHKENPQHKLHGIRNASAFLKFSLEKKTNPLATLEKAEQLMRQAPFNLRFIKNLCNAAVEAQLPEAAIQTLEILSEHQPENLAFLEPLADFYHDSKCGQQEYECRSRILQLKPNDTNAMKKLKNVAAQNTIELAGWDTATSYRDVIKSPQ